MAPQWSPSVPLAGVFAEPYVWTHRSLVYMVHDETGPLYVGCTTKPLRERMRQHSEAKSRSPIAALVRTARAGDSRLLVCWFHGTTTDEHAVIREIAPRFNKQHPNWRPTEARMRVYRDRRGCARPSRPDTPLARWMRQTGTTVSEFARQIGRSHKLVHKYLKGGLSRPSPSVVLAIMAATDGAVRPSDFYDLRAAS